MSDNNGVFVWGGEADAYFERNATALAAYDPSADPVFELLTHYPIVKPETILDLGCASGERLSALAKHFDCDGIGVDASGQAIAAANKRDPSLMWVAEPIEGGQVFPAVDTIVCSMVLHWLQRDVLFHVMHRIDWLLQQSLGDKYLVINDFHPEKPTKNLYHHRPSELVYTFKRRYEDIFIETGLYRHIGTHVYGYHGTDEPAAVTLLKRNSDC